jgi:hypothetical protein
MVGKIRWLKEESEKIERDRIIWKQIEINRIKWREIEIHGIILGE